MNVREYSENKAKYIRKQRTKMKEKKERNNETQKKKEGM
jgi:hypothetical protein